MIQRDTTMNETFSCQSEEIDALYITISQLAYPTKYIRLFDWYT